MDKSNAIHLARGLLSQHGVTDSACAVVSAGGWIDAGAKGLVLDLFQADAAQAEALLSEAARLQCPVAVVTGNAGSVSLAMAALGDADDYSALYEKCGRPVFTAGALDALCVRLGFELADSASCGEAVTASAGDDLFNAGGTTLGWAVRRAASGKPMADEPYMIRLYCPCAKQEQPAEKPFLTVIIRTMGTRILALREGLLCLNAQTDQDFEVLIVGHRIKDESLKSLRQLIAEEPESNRRKIRLLTCYEGKRAVPINLALKHARGEYFAIFDDDDILFDNWVEAYHEAAKKTPGAVLHQYCVSQEAKTIELLGKECITSTSGFDAAYCDDFHAVRQLKYNNSPLMCVAFPMHLPRMGYLFDETLDVCEDWDYLMRVTGVCGTAEAGRVVGAIYRRWENVINSSALFDQDYWRRTEQGIKARMDENTIVLPRQGAAELRELLERAEWRDKYFDTALYVDQGNGFDEYSVRKQTVQIKNERLLCEFDVKGMKPGCTQRWDPDDRGRIVLWNVKIIGADASGKGYQLPVTATNGLIDEKRFIFAEDDPQIMFDAPEDAELVRVIIECSVRWRFDGMEMEEVLIPEQEEPEEVPSTLPPDEFLASMERQASEAESASFVLLLPWRAAKMAVKRLLGFYRPPEQAPLLVRGLRCLRHEGLAATLKRLIKRN